MGATIAAAVLTPSTDPFTQVRAQQQSVRVDCRGCVRLTMHWLRLPRLRLDWT